MKQLLKSAMKQWASSMAPADLAERLNGNRESTEYGVDPFGFSVDFTMSAVAPFLWMYKNYFRVETKGIENVPAGRVLLISNHSGQLPLDGAMIGASLLVEGNPPRAIRSMVEKWVPRLPYVSTIFSRMGQIVGTPENCKRLLERDEAILVFPEGLKGISKLYANRYQLVEFGLGFMRLALETNTPIVPIAVIGAEEQAPAIVDLKSVGKLFGMPSFPITPYGLPFPMPTKYRIRFGAPLKFEGRADDDDVELEKKVRVVKSQIQSMLDKGLKERKSVFF
jgi:1-acyl-sn-glycerol-3-phosphate acyltransferase